jgi:carbonic anhydrase
MAEDSPARLLANNRAWAAAQVRRDPEFFARLCELQRPAYLWIGCADSRVPANVITGLAPGEIFVHRNVANVVAPGDPNCTAALQYAIEVLHVRHVIVCGHYGCGGVEAALGTVVLHGPVERWISPIRSIAAAHASVLDAIPDAVARARRLAELNVAAQVESVTHVAAVREAWQRGRDLAVHGWIYDLSDGLLRDLGVTVAGLSG